MLDQFRDVFKSFQNRDVKYVVIGGIAAILYGVPRNTVDLDILIEATEANAEQLLLSLRENNFGTAYLTDAVGVLNNEISIFRDWVRLDVQTSTPGLKFEDAWEHRNTMQYLGQEFQVASLDDLLSSKMSAAREIDLNDVSILNGLYHRI